MENHLNTYEEEEGKQEDREIEEVEEEQEKEEESQLMTIKTLNNDCRSSRRQKQIPVTKTKDFLWIKVKGIPLQALRGPGG
jgi:hypothetical protein